MPRPARMPAPLIAGTCDAHNAEYDPHAARHARMHCARPARHLPHAPRILHKTRSRRGMLAARRSPPARRCPLPVARFPLLAACRL